MEEIAPFKRNPHDSAVSTTRLELGGNLSVRLKQARSDFPGHTRIQLEFSDGYLSDLVQEHGWSEDQCRKLPEQLCELSASQPCAERS